MRNERCETCRFWTGSMERGFRDGDHGFCLRMPPIYVGSNRIGWPLSEDSDWCGEWGEIVTAEMQAMRDRNERILRQAP